MNYMEEVAKMFGVELGEEFVCSNGYEYKFTNNGLLLASDIPNKEGAYDQVFMGLLIGSIKLKRKNWKPKYNEKYWSVGPGGVLEPGCWLNDFIDVAMYRLGNCYKTFQEAEANRDKWVAFYASDEVLEVK